MCLFFIFKTEDQDTHNVISRFRTSIRSRYPGFFAASREFTPDEMLHPNPHIFFGTQESPTHPPPRTCSTTVSEPFNCFKGEGDDRLLHFLDTENGTCHQFDPPIIQHNIMTNLSTQTRDKCKTGSTWDPKTPKESFLTSLKNSISTIHVDTSGQVITSKSSQVVNS